MNIKTIIGTTIFVLSFCSFFYAFIVHNKYAQFPEYSKLETFNRIDVVSNPITNKYIQNTYRIDNCSITQAYLYIEATVNNEPIAVDYGEDICFGINQRCKHLIMNNNKINIPKYIKNAYLYDLSNISLVDYDFDTQETKGYYPNSDLIDNFQSRKIEIVANVSSKQKNRTIHKMVIYYVCAQKCPKESQNCGIKPLEK